MATEKNLQTIDLKIGSQSQLNENINTYEEGTLFGTTDLIGVGDLAPDLRNKVENNAKVNSSNTFTESQIFNKDITINGNIIQKGDTYKTHAEELYTKKNIIFTREGAISTLGDNEYTGIQAVKYDGTNDGQLVFDKDGTARVGDVGDTQPLATRSEKEELVGGNLLQWDAVNNKIIDAGKTVSDVDDVLEYDSKSGFPATGETGKIYVDKSTNLTYRWSGSTYIQLGGGADLNLENGAVDVLIQTTDTDHSFKVMTDGRAKVQSAPIESTDVLRLNELSALTQEQVDLLF